MKTLLINSYSNPETTAGIYKDFLYQMPPIAFAYLASVIEKAGYKVKFYDDQLEKGNREKLINTVKTYKPDVIGLSCVTPTANQNFYLAKFIKENFKNIKIIMGNIHPTIYYESILKKGIADFVVIGEGEKTIVELLNALQNDGNLLTIKGISFLNNGNVIVNPPQPLIEDLDSIPYPAWHHFPISKYEIFNFASVKRPGTLILGSRGCPFKCTFCCLKIAGTSRRVRRIENLIDEISFLHYKFGYKQISFIDPIFPFSKKEGLEFSEKMISSGLHKKVVWITETRIDLVDLELLENMKKSGLRRIMFGFESGMQESINTIKKDFTIKAAKEAVSLAKKAGIEVIGFFMIGVPGDTKKSISETINFSILLDIDFAKFTVFSPFPGTQDFINLKEKNKIKDTEEWERFTNYPTFKTQPIYIPDELSLEDIIYLQKMAFLKFYLRLKILFRLLFKIRTLKTKDILRGFLFVIYHRKDFFK